MRDCNSEVLEKKGVDSDPVLLPKFSCHVLRHTFATRMCESGLNVKVVQSVLADHSATSQGFLFAKLFSILLPPFLRTANSIRKTSQ